MKVWVKALQINREADATGREVTYHPGDWFEVNTSLARRLAAEGRVEMQPLTTAQVYELVDCGVCVRNIEPQNAESALRARYPNLQIGVGLSLDFARTLLWDATLSLRRLDLLAVGFHRLARGWQIAAPLWAYQELARDIGTERDRALTEEVIHDLRVMVYDTRMLFVKRDPDTRELLDTWARERERISDERLAFMVAIYRVKPLCCALPTTWKQ